MGSLREVRPLYLGMVLAVALSGCSLSGTLSDNAIDYNETAANAADGTVLLNILRARDQRGIHLTAISQLRNQYQVGASAGAQANLPFGGGATSVYTVIPNVTVSGSASPSMDVAILDTKEFMQGFLDPIEMKLVEYFWSLGWSRDMLLRLFVHRVEFDSPICVRETAANTGSSDTKCESGELVRRIINSPSYKDGKHFLRFVRLIRELRKAGLRATAIETKIKISPALSKANVKLATFMEAEKRNLIFDENDLQVRLLKPTVVYRFCLTEVADCDADMPDKIDKIDKTSATFAIPLGKVDDLLDLIEKLDSNHSVLKHSDRQKGYKITFIIRSVQSMLYYIGQVVRGCNGEKRYLRVSTKDRGKQWSCVDEEPNPLTLRYGAALNGRAAFFRLDDSTRPGGRYSFAVNYDGTPYYVPRGDSELHDEPRTEQVLSLLTQLIALKKSAKELPTTSAVTLVGGP